MIHSHMLIQCVRGEFHVIVLTLPMHILIIVREMCFHESNWKSVYMVQVSLKFQGKFIQFFKRKIASCSKKFERDLYLL